MRERERKRKQSGRVYSSSIDKVSGKATRCWILSAAAAESSTIYCRQLKKLVCGQCGGTIEPGLLSTTMKLNMLNLEALKRRGSHYKRTVMTYT